MAEPSPSEFQPYRKVQGKADKDLLSILELTAKAIQARIRKLPVGVGGQVRAAQLSLTLAAIKKMQRSMWTGKIQLRIEQGIKDAEDAAESAIETMTRVAYAALPEGAADELVRSLRLAAESGLKSDAARVVRELSRRVYNNRALDEGKVEDLIRQGLISGLTAKELADTVYKHVSPTTPGGSSYAAMRLARTEINNAFHERQIQGAQRPGVSAVQWNLSGSHKVPDKCNIYAAHKPYPPDEVPDKPHPQCFCYLTYIAMSSHDFQEKLAAGDFDDEIERRTRENLARMGQPVGDITPISLVKPERKTPLTGEKAHSVVPKGLFKRGTLTTQQRKELKTYESGWYAVINGFLRRKLWDDELYKRDAQTATVLQALMKESILPEPIQTWRGMFAARKVFGDSFDSDLTGFKWDDLGFGSTTTNESIVDKFNLLEEARTKDLQGDVKMKVFIPAGVGAVETSTSEKGSKTNGSQAEITLQDGLTWEVIKDHGTNPQGVRELEVEVYPIGSKDE